MISLDILKPHEVTLPTNQESSQSEVPTSEYGRITEGCVLKFSGQHARAEAKRP
jgi:hypothetical protein